MRGPRASGARQRMLRRTGRSAPGDSAVWHLIISRPCSNRPAKVVIPTSMPCSPFEIREVRRSTRVICAILIPAYNSLIAKKTTLNEIGDMLAHIVKHMATKDDIADIKIELKGDIARVQEQVNSIEAQLRETRIETRLGKLEDKVFGAPRR